MRIRGIGGTLCRMNGKLETRRGIKRKRAEIVGDLEWLLANEDEEGFRRYLKSYELVEGTEAYLLAFEAWREKLAEKQSPLQRPGASAPARSRRRTPSASR